MKSIVAFFACLAVFVGFVVCEDAVDESNVLVLTEANFAAAIEENEFILVEFYAPWCGHCKALIPEYAQAANTLAEQGSPIKLAKVDATVESGLAQSYDVKGYPTIKFFKSGTPKDYNGGRKADEIVTWVTRNSGPSTTTLESAEEAKNFVEKDEVVVIGYFESTESTEAMAFIAAADSLSESLKFGITTEKEVIEGMEADINTVVVYKKFDDGKVVFPGVNWTAESIATFIQGEELPLVVTFSDEVAPKIFGGSIRTHLLVFFPVPSDDADSYFKDLRSVAKDYKGQILFVHINTEAEESDRIMEFFSITKEQVPASRLIDMGEDMRKFVPEFSGFDPDKMKAFCDDFIAGDLQPHLNSEEVPEDWDKESVAVLVGKNFKSVALDESKHVFVEFYAPWCGHCKQLAPIWEKLGEHFKDDEDVIIAKMDSTKNEVAEVQIQGFPTLKFFPKGSDKVFNYEGGRTFDDLVKYVERHVSGEVSEDEEEVPLPIGDGPVEFDEDGEIIEDSDAEEPTEVEEETKRDEL